MVEQIDVLSPKVQHNHGMVCKIHDLHHTIGLDIPNSERDQVRVILPPLVLQLKSRMSKVSANSMNYFSEIYS